MTEPHPFVHELWHTTGGWSLSTLPTVEVMSRAEFHYGDDHLRKAMFIGLALIYAQQKAKQREMRDNRERN